MGLGVGNKKAAALIKLAARFMATAMNPKMRAASAPVLPFARVEPVGVVRTRTRCYRSISISSLYFATVARAAEGGRRTIVWTELAS